MKNIKNELRKILDISNLYINDDNLQKLEEEVEKILDWVEKLNEIDTEDQQPIIHLFNDSCTVFEQNPTDSMRQSDVLLNAPHKNSTYIIVPKII